MKFQVADLNHVKYHKIENIIVYIKNQKFMIVKVINHKKIVIKYLTVTSV